MSIAIGALCIFTIITIRDEYLMYRKRREFSELCDHFRPHEQAYLAEESKKD